MTSPADEYSGFTMSSELPPERLGLRKSFGAVTFQERREDNTLDKDNESDDDDDEPMNPTLPDSVNGDSGEQGSESNGPIDETEEKGQVYLPGEEARFDFGVPKGAKFTARWIVASEDGDAQEIQMPTQPEKQGNENSDGRDHYSLGLKLEVNRDNYEEDMFVVLDKSEGFDTYALAAFGVAEANSATAEEFGRRLETDTKKGLDNLNGGFTQTDSPWYLEGMTTTSETDSDGDDDRNSLPGSSDGATPLEDGDGGLSRTEKIGIGVGVGVGGLILIGLAIFFFLRHRRRRRAATGGKSLTPANDYMRDKEIHAAQVAETPHSPASDDDNRPRDSTFVAAGDAVPPADRSSAVATPSSMQREVPQSVAHLVEDGMTEEQIRRLEEEERALDQAIEQAGRR